MAMVLEVKAENVPATRQKAGVEIVEIEAGTSLKIETSPHGEEILNAECPAGKKWTASIQVIINETDL